MKQVVSFDKLKLTNNQMDDNGHVSGNRTISQLDRNLNLLFADNIKLHAQIPAQIPHRLFTAEECFEFERRGPHGQFQDLRLPRDVFHCRHGVSESQGETQPFL